MRRLTKYTKVTKAKRGRIFARDGHKCVACGSTKQLTVDHIIPIFRGGTNLDVNLQTLCKPCNNEKGHGPKPGRKDIGGLSAEQKEALNELVGQ